MSFNIGTIAPGYLIVLCILAAAGITWVLYRKHSFEKTVLVKLMMALRFTGLFLLFLLLLSPFIKLKTTREIKPVLLLFVDNSLSVDSATHAGVNAELNDATLALSEKYNIRKFYFAADVQSGNRNVDRTATSIAAVIDRMNEEFQNGNSGTAVIFSDGIVTAGSNPMFKTIYHKTPLHCVGLGDTVQKPDAWISGFNGNSTAFFGNEFVLNFNLQSYGFRGKNVNLDLFENGKKIKSKSIQISENRMFYSDEFIVKPGSVGMKSYEIKMTGLNGESNSNNNSAVIQVNVVDTRRKIAIVYHAPHPDIGALSRALENFGQYEITKMASVPPSVNTETDLYILHGFSGNRAEQAYVNELIKNRKPFWQILSAQSNPSFSALAAEGMGLSFDASKLTDVQPVVNSGFSEFSIDEFESDIKSWPPLKVPLGKYAVSPLFKVQLLQKIGAVETEYPLFGFTGIAGSRQAWLFGEGIWKWRMRNQQMSKDAAVFDQWVIKSVQYLTATELKNNFRVFTEKSIYEKGQNYSIFAEYYDAGGNLNNSEEVLVKISGTENQKSVKMSKSGNRYRLDLPAVNPGDYDIQAIRGGQKKETAISRFSVTNVLTEMKNLTADHGLLRRLSVKNNGKFFKKNEIQSLLNFLETSDSGNSVLKEEIRMSEFIHLKWLFALLVLLFGAEWFLRKREGGY